MTSHSDKEDLTRAIAHDLNNLLACIAGDAELLELEAAHLDKSRERILAAVERALVLTRRLNEPAQRATSVLDTTVLLRRLVPTLPGVLPANATLRVSLCPDVARVVGSVNDLELIIMNLASNAGNSVLPGGQVHIALRPGKNGQILLEVTNSGPKISTSAMSRLFDNGYSTTPGGSGLGLGLVRDAVQNLGGTIDVVSSDTGTCFAVKLPRAGASRASCGCGTSRN